MIQNFRSMYGRATARWIRAGHRLRRCFSGQQGGLNGFSSNKDPTKIPSISDSERIRVGHPVLPQNYYDNSKTTPHHLQPPPASEEKENQQLSLESQGYYYYHHHRHNHQQQIHYQQIPRQQQQRYAVLVDAENTQQDAVPLILRTLKEEYNAIVDVRRVYGDFSREHIKKWRNVCFEESFVPVHAFSFVPGKGSSDSALLMDALELLYNDNARASAATPVDGFCIVSSDSDFTRLSQRLREAGQRVIGAGHKHTPTPFVRSCDTFIFVDDLINQEIERLRVQQEEAAAAAEAERLEQEEAAAAAEAERLEQEAQDKQNTIEENKEVISGEKASSVQSWFGSDLFKAMASPISYLFPRGKDGAHDKEPAMSPSTPTSVLAPGKKTSNEFPISRDGSELKTKGLRNDDSLEYDLLRVHDSVKRHAGKDGWAFVGAVAAESKVDYQHYGVGKFSFFIKMFPDEFECKQEQTTMFVRRVSGVTKDQL